MTVINEIIQTISGSFQYFWGHLKCKFGKHQWFSLPEASSEYWCEWCGEDKP